MTKYIAAILKILGVDNSEYIISNYWEESTDKNIISLIPRDKDYHTDDIITIYWEEDSCYLHIENNLEIDEYGHISYANPLFKTFSLPVFNLSLSPEEIHELWLKNKEDLPYPNERFGTIYSTEVPDMGDLIILEKDLENSDPETEEEGGRSKNGRLGRKRNNL